MRSFWLSISVALIVSSSAASQEVRPPYAAFSGMGSDAATAAQRSAALHFGFPLSHVLDLGQGQTLELVLIPPGEFMMGGLLPPEETARVFGGDPGYFELEHPATESSSRDRSMSDARR